MDLNAAKNYGDFRNQSFTLNKHTSGGQDNRNTYYYRDFVE